MTTEQIHDGLKQSMQAWIDHHCERADITEIKASGFRKDRDAAVADLDTLRANNKRLREALERIANPYHTTDDNKELMIAIAKQALQGDV